MSPPIEDTYLQAVQQREHSYTNKILGLLLGFTTAVCPAAAGYFAYRQAGLEAAARSAHVQATAAAGYRAVADPMKLVQDALREDDWRIQRLEQTCAEKASLLAPALPPPPPGLVPLQRARLYRELPKTLGEAAAGTP